MLKFYIYNKRTALGLYIQVVHWPSALTECITYKVQKELFGKVRFLQPTQQKNNREVVALQEVTLLVSLLSKQQLNY